MTDRYDGPFDAALEARLVDLAAAIDFPPTPPLAVAVSVAIRERAAERRGVGSWAPLRRGLVFGLLAALLVVGAAAAIGIGLGGLRLTFGDPSPEALPSGVTADRALGQRLSVEQARAAAGFEVRVPRLAAVGDPDHVYFREPPAGGQVALVYGERAGFPAGEDGVALVVTQFRADIGPETFEKLISGETSVQAVQVGEVAGYWIEGGEHFIVYVDADGDRVETTLRLIGDTLIWEEDGVTLRVEGAPSLDGALQVAGSLSD